MFLFKMNHDGAVHAVGNGRMLVYSHGADWVGIHGPTYSSAPLLSGNWRSDRERDGGGEVVVQGNADGANLDTRMGISHGNVQYASRRRPGTSIWEHQFYVGGESVGQSCELADASGLPVYFMRVSFLEPMTLVCKLRESDRCHPQKLQDGRLDQALLIAADTSRVFIYPAGEPGFLNVAGRGDAWRGMSIEGDTLSLRFGAGTAYIVLAAGGTYADAEYAGERAQQAPFERHEAAAEQAGAALMRRLRLPQPSARLSAAHNERLRELCESAAFVITTQQAEDGGVIAGYPYPMAYVRDQYGTARGLLTLGLMPEALRNLQFRFAKWRRFGNLRNAESMGHDRIRHVHENDDVEVPAYTILQAFDYAEASGDTAVLREMFPMLEWCWTAQTAQLRGNMLPFNGDETYVAGGFLPRSALNDGSMEATLLYLESGSRLLPFARISGLWTKQEAAHYEHIYQQTERHYRDNFMRDGRFIANQPQRRTLPGMPDFRHGVCEHCISIGWTRRNEHGRYLCPACRMIDLPSAEPLEFELHSAGLVPAFIHTDILQCDEIALGASRASGKFAKLGYLPTVEGGQAFVGYDEGLLLYALTELDDPLAADVFEHLLNLADSTDAYVEYYNAGKPYNTRYRPWETGINISALVRYADKRH